MRRPAARFSLLLALALALAACAPGPAHRPDPGTRPRIARTVIYMIHGEASYTWHDSLGRRRQADTEAVAQAEEVALHSPRAEVFIFHQTRPSRRYWGPDGVMLHYRNGLLERKERYFRMDSKDFAAEAALFARHAAAPPPRACAAAPDSLRPETFFLYFGHEIPTASLMRGLERFAAPCPSARPFAMVALSACHGGTPAMTQAMSPFASFLLASPGDLHLSFLDSRAFAQLWEAGPKALAEAMAQETFSRLSRSVHTEITLALYDMEKSAPWLEERRGAWDFIGKSYRDCGEDPAFGQGGNAAGASVWYRAPRFGPRKGKASHSGWDCANPLSERFGATAPLK